MLRERNARKVWASLSSAMRKARSFLVAPFALFSDPAR